MHPDGVTSNELKSGSPLQEVYLSLLELFNFKDGWCGLFHVDTPFNQYLTSAICMNA